MRINFYPDSDDQHLIQAANEYTQIWNQFGSQIINIYRKITELNFVEKEINAIIIERSSFSHPLTLRASYSTDVKRGTLIHELGHRLLVGNHKEVTSTENKSLDIHKQLFLILFDVWEEIFGLNFAQIMIVEETKRGTIYEQAWNWSLSIPREKRKVLFATILREKKIFF